MDKSNDSLNWFEISTIDFARAKKFYKTIFAIKMGEVQEMMIGMMMEFPQDHSNH